MIDRYGNVIEWIPEVEGHEGPIYMKIAGAIENDIQSGKLIHGAKLPPQRVIANYLGLNHGTVTRAYKLCEEKGLLKGITGKGTFVSGSAGLPVELLTDHEESDIISLGMALPVYELNEKIEMMIKEVMPGLDYGVALKYCPPEGHLRHRYIAANWLKDYGVDAKAESMIITAGTQNALAVILISLFEKSDRIAVDELTYTGLKSLAEYLGIILVPVKNDEGGMVPSELELVCKRDKIKGVFLMPDCHNPTSMVLSDLRRRELAEVIEAQQLLLLEDGTCSFTLKRRQKPVSTMIPHRSYYIHGTSKAISPAMRISYLIAPDHSLARLQQGINNLNWMASPFTAEILSLLQSTGRYEEIVKMKVDILSERNRLFDRIFEGYDYKASESALFRMLELKGDMTGSLAEQKAISEGIQVFDINRFHAGVDDEIKALRVSVSSAKDIAELEQGLIKLRCVIEEAGDQVLYRPII